MEMSLGQFFDCSILGTHTANTQSLTFIRQEVA